MAVAGFVLGGWAVPLGFVLGLGPLATFVASASGGLVGCWVFLLCGEWVERLLGDKRSQSSAETADSSAADENVKQRAKIERFYLGTGVLNIVLFFAACALGSFAGSLLGGWLADEVGHNSIAWMTAELAPPS